MTVVDLFFDMVRILAEAARDMREQDEARRKCGHLIQRAKERYGLDITFDDVKRMEDAIKQGRAIKGRSSGQRRKIYYVACHGRTCRVVYDTEADEGRGLVVTILPPSGFLPKRHKRGKKHRRRNVYR